MEVMKAKSQLKDLSEEAISCDCLRPCSQISFQFEKYYSDFLHVEGFNPPWATESVKP